MYLNLYNFFKRNMLRAKDYSDFIKKGYKLRNL